ncbi:DgyrCDS12232 [Dimorphilus gyrociliatus]|uniref:mitogen-activated protein kinase kinase n=1 Tax=Dimorphilus gyrociliatus TaxID=2664684 RepID=A0A7I8W6P0_9ANNE|nr:DgyrCDS12232 [Dimorphilus gyrociliatus]
MASSRCPNERDLANSPNGDTNRGQSANYESNSLKMRLNFHTPPRGQRSRPTLEDTFNNISMNGGTVNGSSLSQSPRSSSETRTSSGKRPQLNLNFKFPQKPHRLEDEHANFRQITRNSGLLEINVNEKIKVTSDELVSEGELGHGNCGHVHKMRHKERGTLMAVKQMRKSGNKEDLKRILMDIDIVVKSHDCRYIVKCLGYFINEVDVWICMELMDTCLDKLIRKLKQGLPENIIGKVAVATVNALHYLKEKHGVIHRDVKPSNILLSRNGSIKLCDFGISGRLDNSKAKTRNAGCVAYLSPERIEPVDPDFPVYDVRADVWSLGITLIELATGKFPYPKCTSDFEVLSHIVKDDPPSAPRSFSINFAEQNDNISFRYSLRKDPSARPKYQALLNHQFLKYYEERAVDVGSWYHDQLQKMTEIENGS